MLAAAFIGQGIDALRSPKPAADAARPALEGLQKLPDPVATRVPTDAETFAKANAAVQIGGGLLLATGKLPRFASAALAATVIPGNLGAHMFWSEVDPERKAQKRREFLADISLLGGLIIASADTAGKPSLGWRGRRAARKVSETVSSTLPGSSSTLLDGELADKRGHGLQAGAERGRELALAHFRPAQNRIFGCVTAMPGVTDNAADEPGVGGGNTVVPVEVELSNGRYIHPKNLFRRQVGHQLWVHAVDTFNQNHVLIADRYRFPRLVLTGEEIVMRHRHRATLHQL